MVEKSKELGLTHVLISQNGLDYWVDYNDENEGEQRSWISFIGELEDFTGKFGRLLHQEGDSFFLYQLEIKR